MGQYVAMPVFDKKMQAQTEQKANESAPVQTETQTAVQNEQPAPQPVEPVTEQIPPHKQENPAIPNTPSTKETKIMNETPTIIHTVSAPAQTSAQNNEPANPMDELLANIEDMKAKSKALFDDSASMVRKVREVALAQRQKEREYQQTKRAIERIRLATGAA